MYRTGIDSPLADNSERPIDNRSQIKLVGETIDDHGVSWLNVEVPDMYMEDPEGRGQALRDKIHGFNQLLVDNPDWQSPEVVKIKDDSGKTVSKELALNNSVSEQVYAHDGMRYWREQYVPTAKALYYLQRADEVDEFEPGGQSIDPETKDFFMYAWDAIAIRTRAQVMSEVAGQYIRDDRPTRWVSLACGAAVPVLDAIKNKSSTDQDVQLTLVDRDTGSLDFAEGLAREQGMVAGEDYNRIESDLLKSMIFSNKLVDQIGKESADLVDVLGLFEYLPDGPGDASAAVLFMRNAYDLVRPGGAVVIGNMLDTHPELDFNVRGVGWPKIYPRSKDEIMSIIERAGVDPANVTAYVPQDGIYTTIEIRKSEE